MSFLILVDKYSAQINKYSTCQKFGNIKKMFLKVYFKHTVRTVILWNIRLQFSGFLF